MDTLIFLGYEILSAFLPVLVIFLIVRHHNVQKDVPYTNSHFFAVIVFSLYIVGVYHFTGAGTIYDGLLYGFTFRQDQLNFIPFSHTIDIVETHCPFIHLSIVFCFNSKSLISFTVSLI